ncbi:site-specific integrase [Mycobacterium intracellulare subsp. intracellulare]|nr:site-specific integrase [Mycobacterium intracellulare]UGU07995.1 site-specific integrase [Mycobacterium intracellulare subsp. intracellulare]
MPSSKTVQRTETFAAEKPAKARLREIETHLASAKGRDPSSQRAKANRPLGEYAKQYLDSLAGQIDSATIQGYEKLYRTHIAPVFGSKPVASVTTADVAQFRANLLAPYKQRSFVTRGKASAATARRKRATVQRSPKTVKHIVGALKRILDVAVDDQAIAANPVVANRRHSTKRQRSVGNAEPFKHRPLASNEVAALYDWIAIKRGNSVYALAVLFTAYTGVRAAELQGLQVQDATLSDIPGTVGAVRIARTKKKARPPTEGDEQARVQWIEGTPKSNTSTNRVVPLPPWLADDMRDYLSRTHPFSGINAGGIKYVAHAPLFPGRSNNRGGTTSGDVEQFDWARPVVVDNLYHNYFQPACKALGLGSVRFHDLRHTFATLALSAGEHYMQVSKWLGHSSYVLTLTTYADYIREDETSAPKLARPVALNTENVVPLERKAN